MKLKDMKKGKIYQEGYKYLWTNNRKSYLTILFLLALIILIALIGHAFRKQEKITVKFLNQSTAYAQTIKELSVKPEELSEHDQIAYYIKQVFGKDSSKAFELLQDCGENHALNPLAKNYNNDIYNSIDWGVFQINDHWQGVTNPAFLTDWKINVQMADNIYTRDHHSFKLWTGGRKCGI